MRRLSSTLKTLLAQDTVSTFYIVDIDTYPKLLHTSYYRNLQTPFGLFSADNGLVMVDPPRLATNVDREAYKLTYADPAFEMRALAEAGLTGKKVVSRIGFLNNTGATLNGVLHGQPCLNPNDFITIYKGVIEFATMNISDEEVLMTLECSSPMANLGLVNSHFSSQDYLRQRAPSDTSFDQVYVGSRSVNILWGKR